MRFIKVYVTTPDFETVVAVDDSTDEEEAVLIAKERHADRLKDRDWWFDWNDVGVRKSTTNKVFVVEVDRHIERIFSTEEAANSYVSENEFKGVSCPCSECGRDFRIYEMEVE